MVEQRPFDMNDIYGCHSTFKVEFALFCFFHINLEQPNTSTDMDNPSQQRAELHAEAQVLFEQLRDRPGDEALLTQLTDWVGRSADHRAVYDAVAITWISTLIKQAVEAPETGPGHDTNVH